MSYRLYWGRGNQRTVTTIEDLDQVLDEIAGQRGKGGVPFMVDVLPAVDADDPTELPGLQLGIGHPDRAFVFYTDPDVSLLGYGHEPDLAEWDTDLSFDYGGTVTDYEPYKTRVTPTTVREAAREYVRTGQRPTCVTWGAP